MSIIHLSMSIEGLEQKLAGMRSDNMRAVYIRQSFGMEYPIFIETLEKMKASGMKFIPGDSCTNRKPDGSCGGHEETIVPDETSETVTHHVHIFKSNKGDISPRSKAERWLRETGYSYGEGVEGENIGVKKGDYIIEKWKDLDDESRDFLDGYLYSEELGPDEGQAVIFIKKVIETVDEVK